MLIALLLDKRNLSDVCVCVGVYQKVQINYEME